jgi:hypothetical protein
VLLALAVANELSLAPTPDIADRADELIGVSLQVVLLTGTVVVQLLLVIRLELACLANKAFKFPFPRHTARVEPVSVGIVEGIELTSAAALVVCGESIRAGPVLVEVVRHDEDMIQLETLTAERAVIGTPLVA